MAKGTEIAIITAFAELLQTFPFHQQQKQAWVFHLFGIAAKQRSTSRTGVAGKRVAQFICQNSLPKSGLT